jgi:hypothetical protein
VGLGLHGKEKSTLLKKEEHIPYSVQLSIRQVLVVTPVPPIANMGRTKMGRARFPLPHHLSLLSRRPRSQPLTPPSPSQPLAPPRNLTRVPRSPSATNEETKNYRERQRPAAAARLALARGGRRREQNGMAQRNNRSSHAMGPAARDWISLS